MIDLVAFDLPERGIWAMAGSGGRRPMSNTMRVISIRPRLLQEGPYVT